MLVIHIYNQLKTLIIEVLNNLDFACYRFLHYVLKHFRETTNHASYGNILSALML